MERILQEIEHAIKVNCFYLAIAMALTLPDICAALESPNGETDNVKYKNWYRAHLSSHFGWLSDIDCYSLRCGVVHQGRFGNKSLQYGRVVFTLPHSNIMVTNCKVGDAYVTDLVGFCSRMTDSVRAWFASKQNDPTVQGNLSRLIQYRDDALPQLMAGVPAVM